MIDNLPGLRTFAQVVAAGSLSAASREMDLSLGVVSKRLTQLEKELGVRLLQRTTRKQVLTEDGELFYAEVTRILAAIDRAEMVMSGRKKAIDGTIRLTAPGEFGRQWIAPAVAAFQQHHPSVSIQLLLSDVVMNLLDAGVDLAIRFGSLEDSSLIARPLAPNFRVLCASADYLKQFGVPSHPAELVHHRCILIGEHRRAVWHFEGEENLSVQVVGAFTTNDGGAAHTLALEGAGIARKSIWDVGDDIAGGRLIRILSDFAIPAAPLNALYPNSRHLAPRVRALVHFLSERLGQMRRWDAAMDKSGSSR
jgi:DNA-binding transcriptional LysR family regulator